jgi:hypothetical protein
MVRVFQTMSHSDVGLVTGPAISQPGSSASSVTNCLHNFLEQGGQSRFLNFRVIQPCV